MSNGVNGSRTVSEIVLIVVSFIIVIIIVSKVKELLAMLRLW